MSAGTDTILSPLTRIAVSASRYRQTVDMQVLDRGIWQASVAEVESTSVQGEQVFLWGVWLITVLVLLVLLLYEKYQNVRLVEKSLELEQLSTELLRANQVKSEFLANMSHEFRTPLNAIVGFIDLLRDGVYGEISPRQVSPVDRIASSAVHLRHLVDQVLDLAKMTAGRLEVQSEVVYLHSFVLNVASEVEALISENGLKLFLAVPRTLPRVRTDPTHLRQILLNLLTNAARFTLSGSITIRAALVNKPSILAGLDSRRKEKVLSDSPVWIALEVIDTGVGIAADNYERIFGEFEQIKSSHQVAAGGTGLGLTISRRLARLLGGNITVVSELARGSTFTLWLAVETADLEVASATSVGGSGLGGVLN